MELVKIPTALDLPWSRMSGKHETLLIQVATENCTFPRALRPRRVGAVGLLYRVDYDDTSNHWNM